MDAVSVRTRRRLLRRRHPAFVPLGRWRCERAIRTISCRSPTEGSGIELEPMGDFYYLSYMHDFGIKHSILYLNRQ